MEEPVSPATPLVHPAPDPMAQPPRLWRKLGLSPAELSSASPGKSTWRSSSLRTEQSSRRPTPGTSSTGKSARPAIATNEPAVQSSHTSGKPANPAGESASEPARHAGNARFPPQSPDHARRREAVAPGTTQSTIAAIAAEPSCESKSRRAGGQTIATVAAERTGKPARHSSAEPPQCTAGAASSTTEASATERRSQAASAIQAGAKT